MSRPALAIPGPAIDGLAKLDPKSHKFPEYKTTPKAPSAYSGGGLVPPWTYPGTIEPQNRVIFDHRGLYNSPSRTLNAHASAFDFDRLQAVRLLIVVSSIFYLARMLLP